MKQSPQPLYRKSMPAVKHDPHNFMQALLIGAHKSFNDIDLENVPSATAVDNANRMFSARTAAAIFYGANTFIIKGSAEGADYGWKILAKMAYSDYFSGPDQVPERVPTTVPGLGNRSLREEVSDSITVQKAGTVGTVIDDDYPLVGHIHKDGDYDILLTAYVKLYYKYYNELSVGAQNNLFNTLLSVRGQYTNSEQFSFEVDPFPLHLTIPETENHRLMIQSAKYLTNQLYFQQSVLAGQPDHANFDNNRNGDGGSNPPMVDVILGMLNGYLTHDFIEYNAHPYQDFTMTALMNLHSYAYDDRVRLMARMVLDYVSAKVAVSSKNLRRFTPFRRRNEDQHFGPTIQKGFLGSPLVYNSGLVPGSSPPAPYEPDPQGAFYTLLAGTTGMLKGNVSVNVPPHHAPAHYAFEMIHAGLSDYRIPPAILDLFVSQNPNHRFYQAFAHQSSELYAGSASYLISGGGVPSDYAYRANIDGILRPKGDSKDLGVAVPTTFIPDLESPLGESGSGTSLIDIIQFGKISSGTDSGTVHLGVAPDFACGGPIYLPDAFELTKNVGGENWTFVDRGSDNTKPGYYLAIYRVRNELGEDWGFLEAYDTWFKGGSSQFSFEAFQKAVKRLNGSPVLQFGPDKINTYRTQSGQRIQFTLIPHTTIVSTTEEPTHPSSFFAHGTIINSIGSGLINISNPSVGTVILDAHVQSANGDPLFGLHHPVRTSETGEVEAAGGNQEVWVDSNYPGTGKTAGDFGDPFRTLGDAINAVTVGGTVRLINVKSAENAPVLYTKRMTLRAAAGSVTLPR